MNQNALVARGVQPASARGATVTDHWPRVLLAEDDDDMRKLLIRALREDGYAAVECCNGVDLFARLEPFIVHGVALEFDVIVSDIRMPGLTGLEILEDLHDFQRFPPMILITAFGDKGVHARARSAGAVAVLDKPFDIEALLTKLHEIAPRDRDRRTRMEDG